jgi:hypothetical protein
MCSERVSSIYLKEMLNDKVWNGNWENREFILRNAFFNPEINW